MSNLPVISDDIREVLKKVSRTLYLSIKVLPEPVKSYMGLGYLMCRALDTVVDSPEMSSEEKIEILESFRKPGEGADSKAAADKMAALAVRVQDPGERELLLRTGDIMSVYSNVPEEDRSLFAELLDGIISGMEIDVRCFSGSLRAFKNGEELKNYCHLIGGVPGIFWARLYRMAIRKENPHINDFPSTEDAERIGCALQMTNILQDVAADLRNGRCYLPADELAEKELKPEQLFDPANMKTLRPVVSKWQTWALGCLDRSEHFVSMIPLSCLSMRAAVIWPVYWSLDTMALVAQSNLLEKRPKLKRGRIYSTLLNTPKLLLSNIAFMKGYCFRRETLILSLTGPGENGNEIDI